MTIIYRETDPVSGRWTGNSGGIDLSAFQIDQNFYECVSRIATLETNESFTVSIDFITISGNELTFHMTNHTLQGPFAVPISVFFDRGTWQPFTPYAVNDTFTINGTLYLVIFAHTSAATFSAGANDGLGHNYYSPMLSVPGSALPTGGPAGQVLTKSSGVDFAVTWSYKLPAGGATGQVLLKASSTNQDAAWGSLDALNVSFTPPSGSGLLSTNVASALAEIEGNIGGGGVSLSGLADVNVTEGPGINGYFLEWNDASGKWVAGANATVLSGLADVDVTEGVGINGFFLQWDNGSGNWIAAASSATLSGLTDVSVTEGAGINGEFLKWNDGSSKWVASSVSLSILTDVNVTEGAGINGYFLKWDNGTSKWVASLTGATAVALSGLSDVNVTEGAGIDGYALKWNNGTGKWIAGVLASTLSGLTDVNVTEGAGIDGEYLKWNNGTGKWIAGALGTAAADDVMTAAQYRANTASKVLTTDTVWGAAATVTLTDAATVTMDFNTFINAKLTGTGGVGASRTLGAASNAKVGQSGIIEWFPVTGALTLVIPTGSTYVAAGGISTLSLSNTNGARDAIAYSVLNDGKILLTVQKALAT